MIEKILVLCLILHQSCGQSPQPTTTTQDTEDKDPFVFDLPPLKLKPLQIRLNPSSGSLLLFNKNETIPIETFPFNGIPSSPQLTQPFTSFPSTFNPLPSGPQPAQPQTTFTPLSTFPTLPQPNQPQTFKPFPTLPSPAQPQTQTIQYNPLPGSSPQSQPQVFNLIPTLTIPPRQSQTPQPPQQFKLVPLAFQPLTQQNPQTNPPNPSHTTQPLRTQIVRPLTFMSTAPQTLSQTQNANSFFATALQQVFPQTASSLLQADQQSQLQAQAQLQQDNRNDALRESSVTYDDSQLESVLQEISTYVPIQLPGQKFLFNAAQAQTTAQQPTLQAQDKNTRILPPVILPAVNLPAAEGSVKMVALDLTQPLTETNNPFHFFQSLTPTSTASPSAPQTPAPAPTQPQLVQPTLLQPISNSFSLPTFSTPQLSVPKPWAPQLPPPQLPAPQPLPAPQQPQPQSAVPQWPASQLSTTTQVSTAPQPLLQWSAPQQFAPLQFTPLQLPAPQLPAPKPLSAAKQLATQIPTFEFHSSVQPLPQQLPAFQLPAPQPHNFWNAQTLNSPAPLSPLSPNGSPLPQLQPLPPLTTSTPPRSPLTEPKPAFQPLSFRSGPFQTIASQNQKPLPPLQPLNGLPPKQVSSPRVQSLAPQQAHKGQGPTSFVSQHLGFGQQNGPKIANNLVGKQTQLNARALPLPARSHGPVQMEQAHLEFGARLNKAN